MDSDCELHLVANATSCRWSTRVQNWPVMHNSHGTISCNKMRCLGVGAEERYLVTQLVQPVLPLCRVIYENGLKLRHGHYRLQVLPTSIFRHPPRSRWYTHPAAHVTLSGKLDHQSSVFMLIGHESHPTVPSVWDASLWAAPSSVGYGRAKRLSPGVRLSTVLSFDWPESRVYS